MGVQLLFEIAHGGLVLDAEFYLLFLEDDADRDFIQSLRLQFASVLLGVALEEACMQALRWTKACLELLGLP